MISKVDDISIIRPEGELDRYEGGLLLKKLVSLIQCEWNKIVIDFREVNHIHFRFLGDLVDLSLASWLLSGGIKLANVSPYAREILRLSGVDRYFETYDSVAEAVLSFRNHLTEPCSMQ